MGCPHAYLDSLSWYCGNGCLFSRPQFWMQQPVHKLKCGKIQTGHKAEHSGLWWRFPIPHHKLARLSEW